MKTKQEQKDEAMEEYLAILAAGDETLIAKVTPAWEVYMAMEAFDVIMDAQDEVLEVDKDL